MYVYTEGLPWPSTWAWEEGPASSWAAGGALEVFPSEASGVSFQRGTTVGKRDWEGDLAVQRGS